MPRVSPEKSSFAQTCNLLSHYLKEKGSLRDLNLGINGEAADTGFSGQASRQVHVNPLNLFPQHASMHDDAISIINSRFVSCDPSIYILDSRFSKSEVVTTQSHI